MGSTSLTTQHRSGPVSKAFVIGIDLGTTNSLMALAFCDSGHKALPRVVSDGSVSPGASGYVPVELVQLPQENLDGTTVSSVLFPSVVFQEAPNTKRFVGLGAREMKFHYRRGQRVFYSIKLDLGTDMDPGYPAAVSPDLDNPVKVSTEILRSMRQAAEELLNTSLAAIPTIITIPASFQSPQRRDTLMAARAAGWDVGADCLLDEPNAALLAYMNRRRVAQRWHPEETVLVFDFGGGTCDITIIDVSLTPSSGTLSLKNLAISRFERLGGDDMDRHLVHTLLKTEFYRASGVEEREWGYGERRHSIWSQLTKLAELLKIRFCEELDKVTQSAGWNAGALARVSVSLPPQIIGTSKGDVVLSDLSLDWQQFSKAMAPFLTADGRQDRDCEYYQITSIFTPVQDTLSKANLKPKDITRVLLVGGSSHNPLVEKAIKDFFPEATVDRPEHMDFLVAEGAAVHAYYHFVRGHDILAPILGDTIGLMIEGGQFEPLIRAGAPIPFPSDDTWLTYQHFRVPRANMDRVDLVVCAGSSARPVHQVALRFDRPVPVGSPLQLRIRMDGNKIFSLEACLPDFPHISIREQIDNPLGLLPMTSKERERRELERSLAKAQSDGILDSQVDRMEELAAVLLDLDRSEVALEWLNQADRRRGTPTRESRYNRANAHLNLGETEAAHEIYVQLSNERPTDWVAAYMASKSANSLADRETYIRRAVTAAPGSGVVQYGLADVLEDKGDFAGAKEALLKSRDAFEAEVRHRRASANTFDWLAAVYDALGDSQKAREARERRSAFERSGTTVASDNLPSIAKPLALRQ